MNTAKGLVMEKIGDELVLLMPGGEFVKYKMPGGKAEIGDEILIPLNREKKRLTINKLWYVAAAAVFLVLFLPILSNSTINSGQTVAYLSVDINPSIELAVDKNFKVQQINTYNSDGDQIIRETKLKGLNATEAVSKITAQAYQDGFLSPKKDNAVVLSLTPIDQSAMPTGIDNKLKSSVEKTLANANLGGVVQTILTSITMRQEAKAEGLSPGKYAILLEATKAGLNITAQDLKNASIATVIKNAGGQVGEIVGKAHEEKDFNQLSDNYKNKDKTIDEEKTNSKDNNKVDNEQKKNEINKGSNNEKSQNNTGKTGENKEDNNKANNNNNNINDLEINKPEVPKPVPPSAPE